MLIATRKSIKKTVAPTRKSTLILHSAGVALAPARSLTSHARRMYLRRYQGQHRFAQFVFAFDLFLLGAVATLALFDAVFFLQSFVPKDGGLSVGLRAPVLRASEEVPMTVVVRSRDGLVHEDVRLRWHVPEWVEIVRSEPPVSREGELFFGRIVPGVEYRSFVVARVRSLPGVPVSIEVSLDQTDRWGFRQRIIGSELRPVVSSAVSVEMPVHITHVARGGSIPVFVKNTSSQTIPSALLRITEGPGTIAGSPDMYLGKLAPSSTRVIFIDLPEASDGTIRLSWQLEDAAHIVAVSSALLEVDAGVMVADTSLPYRLPNQTSDFIIPYQFYARQNPTPGVQGIFLSVFQQDDGTTRTQSFPVMNEQDIPIHLSSQEMASSTQWSVLPLSQALGEWHAGSRAVHAFSNALQFTTEARYYSAAGDQVGVGPIMPLVGQSTRYWIVWSIDPTASGLRDVSFNGTLPKNARATGQFASTQKGTFDASGRMVTWTIPSLAPSHGQGRVTFAFEAEITPSETELYYPLIIQTSVRATDAITGVLLRGESAGEDSHWAHDPRAAAQVTP